MSNNTLCVSPLFYQLLKDIGFPGGIRSYLMRRLAKEGISFLTKVLPVLWTGFLTSCENGEFSPINFRSKCGGAPFDWKNPSLRWLRLEITKVCTNSTSPIFRLTKPGEIPDSGCSLSEYIFVQGLFQLCHYFYKLALPFTDRQEKEAGEDFLLRNEELLNVPSDIQFDDKVRKFIESNFPEFSSLELKQVVASARDGKGSVSDQRAELKMSPRQFKDCKSNCYPEHLEPVKGAFRYRKRSILTGKRNRLRALVSKDIVSIVFVPKDARGPRVIGKENSSLVKLQMGFHDIVKPILQRESHGRIQFFDQTVMQTLAQNGSCTGIIATGDMKNASDRNRRVRARRIFRNVPVVRWLMNNAISTHFIMPVNCRSKTELKAGKPIARELNMLSTMGNGLTFPLLALDIYSSICVAISDDHNYDARLEVYVYGDDFIVPTRFFESACAGLERAGYQINRSKSFIRSAFRESCGGDFYKGHNVTPIRLKLTFADISARGTTLSLNDDSALIKLERHCRELMAAGYHKLASLYYDKLESILGEKLPLSNNYEAPCLVRITPLKDTISYIPDKTGLYPKVRALTGESLHTAVKAYGLDRVLSESLRALEERTSCHVTDILMSICLSSKQLWSTVSQVFEASVNGSRYLDSVKEAMTFKDTASSDRSVDLHRYTTVLTRCYPSSIAL